MKNLKKVKFPLVIGLAGLACIYSCRATIPKGATAVNDFQIDKYLGKWFEIARFDFRFEKNLNNVTATYSQNKNGTITVDNQGYDYVKNKWKQSIGEAKFVGPENVGRLKVSFFKPIWAGYNVIDMDENYNYALVAGNNLEYLWILSREKTIPSSFKKRFVEKAQKLGFKTKNLIWVEHSK